MSAGAESLSRLLNGLQCDQLSSESRETALRLTATGFDSNESSLLLGDPCNQRVAVIFCATHSAKLPFSAPILAPRIPREEPGPIAEKFVTFLRQ
jgi:hypothetical protein